MNKMFVCAGGTDHGVKCGVIAAESPGEAYETFRDILVNREGFKAYSIQVEKISIMKGYELYLDENRQVCIRSDT